MKLLSVASLLTLCGTEAFNMPQPDCFGVDRRGNEVTCNKMQQENRGTEACKNGGSVMRDVEFKKLQVCITEGFPRTKVESANYELVLRGPAVADAGATVLVTRDQMNAQTQSVVGPAGCLTAKWKMQIDTCQPYFEAEFRAWENSDPSTTYAFRDLTDDPKSNDGQFMRRTCDLQTEMTCTGPDGDSCDDLNSAMCRSGDSTRTSGTFQYLFCYKNMEREHEITIRPYYTKCDQNPKVPPTTYEDRRECTETHTFFNETLINPDLIPVASDLSFPGGLVLPANPDGDLKTCYTYSKNFDACTELLPDARLNVVGLVTGTTSNDHTAAPTRFRACYDQTRVEAVDIKLRDVADTPSPTSAPIPDTDAPTITPGDPDPDTDAPTITPGDPDPDCSGSTSKSSKSCKSGKGKGDGTRLRKRRRNERKNQDRF